MHCHRARRLLEHKESQALPAREEGRLADHLQACTACRELQTQLDLTWKALGYHPSVEPSADFLEKVRDRIRDRPAEMLPVHGWNLKPAWQWMALAACALLAAVIVVRNIGIFSETQPVSQQTTVPSKPDLWDEQFLRDLEKTLQHSDAEVLSIYDTWPGFLQEGSNFDSSRGGGAAGRGRSKEIS